MLLRHRAAAASVIALACALAPAAAHATPTYPPGGGDSITVSTTSPTVGANVTVSARTYVVGSDVTVTTVTEGDTSGTTALRGGGGGGGGRAGTSALAATGGSCQTGATCHVAADVDGVATAAVSLTRAGATNVTFSGTGADGSPLTQTVALNVLGAAAAPASDPGTGLAATGPRDIVRTGAIALGMLTVGAALVLAVRRRRDAFSAA